MKFLSLRPDRCIQELAFFLTLILVLIFRYFILDEFAFAIFDSDQSIMWSAAVDFSHGIFKEPRFYGQNYSTNLEALFAVPLLWCKVPVYIALPLVTSFMTLFPFLLVAFLARSRRLYLQACLVLLFPLLMPTEYNMLTSMPRGFVTGIFIASFGALFIFYPQKHSGYYLSGFLFMLGYSVNPNSVVLSVPCLFYLWIMNLRKPGFYLLTLAGIATGAVIHFLIELFYLIHPNHVIHTAVSFKMTLQQLLQMLGNMNMVFEFVTPVFWGLGGMLPVIILLLSILLLILNKKPEGFTLLLSFFIILVTLGVHQISFATSSIFYSYGRMYIAVPVLLAFFIPFLPVSFRFQELFILIITAGLFYSRIYQVKRTVRERILESESPHVISIAKKDVFKLKCQQVEYYARFQNVTLVVEVADYFYDFINYGCGSCYPAFPSTLRPSYERRTWRLEEEQNKVHRNIMIIDFSYGLSNEIHKLDPLNIRYFRYKGYYFILDNKLPTLELMKQLNISIRNF